MIDELNLVRENNKRADAEQKDINQLIKLYTEDKKEEYRK